MPIHVFGLGKPETSALVYASGWDSVDSSAYVQLATEGRMWGSPGRRVADPTTMERLHMALCNLATATGRAMPLSTAGVVFATHSLVSRESARVLG